MIKRIFDAQSLSQSRCPPGPRHADDSTGGRVQGLDPADPARSGFPEALAALKNGRAATIDGAWGSAAGLISAALGLHAPTTLVIVLAHISDVDDFRDDIAVFAGITPELLPAWEKLPREQDASDEVFGKRLRVISRLAGAMPPRLIVTSIQALTAARAQARGAGADVTADRCG